jgi:hypothetical protein
MKTEQILFREPLWPAALAVIAATLLNLLLPPSLSANVGPYGAGLVILLTIGKFVCTQARVWLGHATAAITTLQLIYALVTLMRDLVFRRGQAADLLVAAIVVWSMNVLVFASWYWRLDTGGPHHRARRDEYGDGGAFLFPQTSLTPETRKALGQTQWQPHFIDYLFLAFNASTAFSPTDVPVLSRWAKVLMMAQSSISLTTLAMVAARAVNIL